MEIAKGLSRKWQSGLFATGLIMAVADSSYALDHVAPADLVSSEATVGPSVAHESASFRGIGLCVLILVTAVELLWVGFLLFAVAHIA